MAEPVETGDFRRGAAGHQLAGHPRRAIHRPRWLTFDSALRARTRHAVQTALGPTACSDRAPTKRSALHNLGLLKGQKGAILADDMGLGKTLQALCVANEVGNRVLFVVQTPVVEQWRRQMLG